MRVFSVLLNLILGILASAGGAPLDRASVPADAKWFARRVASEALLDMLREMAPRYPELSPAQKEEMARCRQSLMEE